MDIDYQIRRFAPIAGRLPFSSYLFDLYRAVSRPVFSYLELGTFDPAGTYTVDHQNEKLPPFKLVIDDGTPNNRAKVAGTYEAPVVDAVASLVDEDTVFWEVGAYCGYYSMAFADLVDRVFVFDNDASAMELVEQGIEANGYDNVETVQGTVGEDIDLDSYPDPDLVLMDIDGWELKALRSCDQLLEEIRPTWIVEIHEPEKSEQIHQETDPEEVERLLRENGYELEEICRRVWDYHVLAIPE